MAAHTVPRGTRCLFVGFLLVLSTVASAATRGICPQPATPAALSSHAALVQDAIAKFNATVHASVAASQGLGGYVVVVAGQDVMFQSGYGTTRRSGGHTPNENTGFRVGSVTKVFTDLMLLLEQQRGRVAVSDPVTKFVPQYAPHDPWESSTRGATLKDLGSHMAGLPRYSPCDFFNCNSTLAEIVARINEWTLLQSPGVRPSYSNAGFSLLGGILSQVAGATYEDYLAKYVFSPLGMNNSAFAAPSNLDNIALGYASPSSPPAPLTSLQYVNPAGGLRTTGHDMAEFMKLLHRQNEAAHSTPTQILDGKSIREWLTEPVYHNPAVVPAGALLDDAWYMPWEVAFVNNERASPFGRYRLVTKDGSVDGYNALLLSQPELQLSVFGVISMNGTTSDASQFIDALLFGVGMNLVPAVDAAYASLATLPAVPTDIQALEGAYTGDGVTVEVVYNATGHVLHLTASTDATDAAAKTLAALNLATASDDATTLRWLGVGNVFGVVPQPASCWTLEGGETYNWAFTTGASGTTLAPQGFTEYGFSLTKQ